ncbi:MAG: prolyl-tRNA synthetase associated domain-containing protein [Prevotellaceae bacterium]|nr:prolyl-tRNA synthetase associated domain-containing protein [Prevotellaceae bacterium]
MDKNEIYEYFDKRNVCYEVIDHNAVYNMEEMSVLTLPNSDVIAKNLFVRDKNRHTYYLIAIKGEKRINLKDFKRNNGTGSLTFADDKDMKDILELSPGSVTPLGLLNDKECKVRLFIDKDFMDSPSLIGVHPNENTATIWLRTEDLVRIIREHGNDVSIVEIN